MLLVFLWPLYHLFQAFRTRLGKSAPNPEMLADRFPYYPQTILRVAIGDMVNAREIDVNLNDEKDNRLDWAMYTLAVAFIIVLFVQIGWRVTQTPTAAATRRADTTKTYRRLTRPPIIVAEARARLLARLGNPL